jgi:LPS export ABC transporter protein LptC
MIKKGIYNASMTLQKGSAYLFLTIAIVVQVVFLSPGVLETPAKDDLFIPLTRGEVLRYFAFSADSKILDLPKNAIPDYAIEDFQYISNDRGKKNWRIQSERALVHRSHDLVYTEKVYAHIFNEDGTYTTVKGDEGRYFINGNDLEVFGNVKTVLSDGFTLLSEYMLYRPEKKEIVIPEEFIVHGKGVPENDQKFEFESYGFHFDSKAGLVTLPRKVIVDLVNSKGERTKIFSDHAILDRNTNEADFSMDSSRVFSRRFVKIQQPDLSIQSRTVHTKYSSDSQGFDWITAQKDVTIWDTDENGAVRYATCGKAQLNSKDDLIILTQYPQVYQAADTLTGERMIIHRQTDIIEVEQGNAFSHGS